MKCAACDTNLASQGLDSGHLAKHWRSGTRLAVYWFYVLLAIAPWKQLRPLHIRIIDGGGP